MARPILAQLRALLRAFVIGGHLLLGAIIILGLTLWRASGRSTESGPAIVCRWYQLLTQMLGLKIQVHGRLAERALLVANHISWLDVPVLGSLGPIGFLSKSEVRQWPLIGWMSAQVGTLFIKRGGHQTADLIEQIATRVREQQPVVIFPEGTTSDGHRLRRFHPRLLAAAQQPGVAVQPVAIRYGSNRRPDPIAPFIDDDSLITHLWRILCQPQTLVEVRWLERVVTTKMDRRRVATHCEQQIAQALDLKPSFTTDPAILQRHSTEGEHRQ